MTSGARAGAGRTTSSSANAGSSRKRTEVQPHERAAAAVEPRSRDSRQLTCVLVVESDRPPERVDDRVNLRAHVVAVGDLDDVAIRVGDPCREQDAPAWRDAASQGAHIVVAAGCVLDRCAVGTSCLRPLVATGGVVDVFVVNEGAVGGTPDELDPAVLIAFQTQYFVGMSSSVGVNEHAAVAAESYHAAKAE